MASNLWMLPSAMRSPPYRKPSISKTYGCLASRSPLASSQQSHGRPCADTNLGWASTMYRQQSTGMDGGKRSYLLSLCGQLLRQVLIPCHIKVESSNWIRTSALSYAAETDGHVLGTLCAVTMALLTNRLDPLHTRTLWCWQIQIHGHSHLGAH